MAKGERKPDLGQISSAVSARKPLSIVLCSCSRGMRLIWGCLHSGACCRRFCWSHLRLRERGWISLATTLDLLAKNHSFSLRWRLKMYHSHILLEYLPVGHKVFDLWGSAFSTSSPSRVGGFRMWGHLSCRFAGSRSPEHLFLGCRVAHTATALSLTDAIF